MTQEEKDLLLKDLSARLTYGVICQVDDGAAGLNDGKLIEIDISKELARFDADCYWDAYIDDIKSYLLPMSSMTEEERIEFSKLLVKRYCEEDWEGHISTSYCIEIDNVYTDDENGIKYPSSFSMDAIDWLNKHHFDYRGLIEKGLALEAPEGMYKNK